MARQVISTDKAPSAIGAYSQAVRCGDTVYLSGAIPLVPETMEKVSDDVRTQIEQVFTNLLAVCEAAGGSFDDVVKLNVYLTDLADFPLVNEVMNERFEQPFPARAAIGVSELPKGVAVEVEGIMHLGA
jgi:reactive intermediate/imine deaminase